MISQNISTFQYYNIKRAYICILLFAYIILPYKTFSDNLYVERIGLNEGLSQNSVTAITQDKKGFIWIATQDGLMRYDGYTFKNHLPEKNNSNSISNKSIWSLLIDKTGMLWAGTYGGLNRYNPTTEKFTTYTHNPLDPSSISNNAVMALLEDNKGKIWVGTEFGLNRFDRNKLIFVHYVHDSANKFTISNNYINAIFEDKRGNLWIGTDQGINIYNHETQLFKHIHYNNEIFRTAAIQAIEEDSNGHIWLGTRNNGIFIINFDNNNLSHLTHRKDDKGSLSSNNINTIYRDRSQRIWIGTDDGGLNLYNQGLKRFTHYRHKPSNPNSLSGDNIYSLYEDQSGIFWIGTYTFGISKLSPYGFSSSLVSDKATEADPNPSTDVRTFLVDQHNSLWVGSSYNGVKVTHADGGIQNHLHDPSNTRSLSSNRVYSLFEDKAGVVWVGTLDGWINEYNPDDNSFTRYHLQADKENSLFHGKVRAMWEDNHELLWIALDGGGLHTFDRNSKIIKHYHYDPNDPNSISSNRVWLIYEDHKHELWFGTYGGGLNKFNRKFETFTAYRHNKNGINSIGSDFLMAICKDNQSNAIWLGTDGGGIDYFNLNDESFVNYSAIDGLPNNTLYGIIQDDNGHLWVTHNKGLSRFDPKNKTFYNYSAEEGLQSNEFNGGSYYKSADGKFYFGGIHGYNAFYPNQIITNPYPPPVYITNFQLFNKPIAINQQIDNRVLLTKSIINTKSLTLSYKDTIFSFEFAALDYTLPPNNQYAFRMQGLETEWNYTNSNRRYATYTTLPPGDYTFQVKASNSHGVWNEEGVSLPITITPPFWQTWWFRLLSATAVFIALFTLYTMRVRAVNARNKILKEQVKERTKDLEKTLYELSDTKDALIEAAHKAGMADTASAVLHNVGNLLNNVNTSSSIISELLNNSTANKVRNANQLLIENKTNLNQFITQHPKGKKLLDYYMSLDQPLMKEQTIFQENVFRIKEKITAIIETIAAQQRYAQGGGFNEVLCLESLVEDSLLLQSASIDRHKIDIVRNYDKSVKHIKVQKAKLIQILTNLYINAKESMDACSINQHKLTIQILQDKDYVYISFSDNGVGIDPCLLEKIFAHGYTTKPAGYGFGLHNCANLMTEMGGKIWAESDGINKGAKFVLKFRKCG